MNKISLQLTVLNSQQNLMQLTLNNLTDAPIQDWLLTLDFARFIEPETLSKGSVLQVGTYTKIKPIQSESIEGQGMYQITFNIKSAPLTNYECDIREAYLSAADDNFVAQHHADILQIKLQLDEQQPIDKITAEAADIAVIPKVNSLKVHDGEFVISAQLAYSVCAQLAQNDHATAAINWLMCELSYATQLTADNNAQSNLRLLDDSDLADGEYALTVDDSGVTLKASTASGFIHGAATLLQLVKTSEGAQYVISCVEISDKPRFGYRGLMLDCSRHFHSIATVKRLINQMAHYKLNHFHWHFTDDEGWRLEINAFPQLTEIGAWRGPGTQLDPQFSHLTQKYGGFYTQEEVNEVIEYASQRGITIVPEIDIPGHCRAAIKSLPELLVDPDDGSQYRSIQAYTDNVLSPALAGTYHFLDTVIDEVCALFPAPYVHIGADEVPKGVWEKSAKCQQLMAEQGYENEVELQGHLLRHVEKRLKHNGKRMFGWEEVKFGDKVSKETVVCSWISEEAALACVQDGYDVLLQPSKYTYFDLVQDYAADEAGVDWAGALPLQVAYQYEPLAALNQDSPLRQHILGVQCALWSEVVLNQDRIDHMLFPRLLANAEVSWSAAKDKNWDDFCGRLEGQKQYFKRNKINYRHF
ncbi:beta-hexosaminidase [Psychromonas marina]|uniref:beta-N-acetylhexosaminidase n=1 Tax=Psychromonas marina TaxID=88364 RepID=A0ABQ6DW52_9GAMM|nr:beta-N-acetylhexosaminidase [Psychromonas marina]GLS89366.1 beta-hexosaminidase [Psychromonas marina]